MPSGEKFQNTTLQQSKFEYVIDIIMMNHPCCDECLPTYDHCLHKSSNNSNDLVYGEKDKKNISRIAVDQQPQRRSQYKSYVLYKGGYIYISCIPR